MNAIIDVTDPRGRTLEPEWLAKSERVHRQLRPHLPEDYAGTMARVFAGGGRMAVAAREGEVAGVAVYRVYENTCDGVMMYVDDLVTDEAKRSTGVGKALMDHLQALAKAAGCAHYKLDSGTHRKGAHKFYFREGMTIAAFHFDKPLR